MSQEPAVQSNPKLPPSSSPFSSSQATPIIQPGDVGNYRLKAEQGDAQAQYALGLYYDKKEDYKEARGFFQMAASQGHYKAQHHLGTYYYQGRVGVNQDYKEAIRLFHLSAEQGYVFAYNALGNCYKDGKGVRKDLPEAVRWFELSIAKGYKSAQYNLGLLYLQNANTKEDFKKAGQLFELAANQGHVEAQYATGTYYEEFIKDHKKAWGFYHLAASQGHKDTKDKIHKIFRDYRDQIRATEFQELPALQKSLESDFRLTKDSRKALANVIKVERSLRQDTIDTFQIISKGSNSSSQSSGSSSSSSTLSSSQPDISSIEYIPPSTDGQKQELSAAEKGDADTQYILAGRYFNGEKDLKEAVRLYHLAAEQGHTAAQIQLAFCYANGKGVNTDLTKAVQYYQPGAEKGDVFAQYQLGETYERLADYKGAVKYYQLAANQGEPKALLKLGEFYQAGLTTRKEFGPVGIHVTVIEKDWAKAEEFYRKAVEAKPDFKEAQQKVLYKDYGFYQGFCKQIAEMKTHQDLKAKSQSMQASLNTDWKRKQLDEVLKAQGKCIDLRNRSESNDINVLLQLRKDILQDKTFFQDNIYNTLGPHYLKLLGDVNQKIYTLWHGQIKAAAGPPEDLKTLRAIEKQIEATFLLSKSPESYASTTWHGKSFDALKAQGEAPTTGGTYAQLSKELPPNFNVIYSSLKEAINNKMHADYKTRMTHIAENDKEPIKRLRELGEQIKQDKNINTASRDQLSAEIVERIQVILSNRQDQLNIEQLTLDEGGKKTGLQ